MNEAHVIDRLEFAVEFASEAQAFDAQPRLSAFLGRVATATIDSVFDEFSSADRILRLDRLEIDLGRVGGGDLELQWQERLRERLRAAMQREIHLQSSGQSPDGAIRSRREAQFEALTGFLTDGHWSWRVPERAGVDELAGDLTGIRLGESVDHRDGIPGQHAGEDQHRGLAHSVSPSLR